MDYRNADGSLAQMCGNGLRVVARFLRDETWETSAQFGIATRSGIRTVSVLDDEISADMGAAVVPTMDSPAVVTTEDGMARPAYTVQMPNPHAVVFVDSLSQAGSLETAPTVDASPVFTDGVNVEFVVIDGTRSVHLRVHERGSGETRSCGTGACAAVVAARAKTDDQTALPWEVHVPGGLLHVTVTDADVVLTGPAVIVGAGHIDPTWWEKHQ
jgi:diaminopimelate epimerase